MTNISIKTSLTVTADERPRIKLIANERDLTAPGCGERRGVAFMAVDHWNTVRQSGGAENNATVAVRNDGTV